MNRTEALEAVAEAARRPGCICWKREGRRGSDGDLYLTRSPDMEGERMYRVKARTVGDGQHPSEVVVSVNTADGKQEELIVDRRSLEEGWLRVGYPIRSQAGNFLIELPRETMRGSWRVWVQKNELGPAA